MSDVITPVGLSRDKAHRYFWNGQGPLTSITTAIKALDKSGPLVAWSKRETAACAVRNVDMLATLVQTGGPQAAIDWLKRIPDYQRDSAADLGTRVHALAESIELGHDPDIASDEAPYVAAYRQWRADYSPIVHASEYLVCSLTHGYAGTGDLNVTLAGTRWALDIKTSKGTYPETGLQLAAAVNAEFAGRPGDPNQYTVPPADRCGVLHLRPDGTYGLVPYAVTPDTFRAFLTALDLWRWLQGEAKAIVGQPLTGGQLPDFPKEIAA